MTAIFRNPNPVGDAVGDPWATLTLVGENADNVVDTEEVADNTDDGSEVTYAYSVQEAGSPTTQGASRVVDSFAIPITVTTAGVETGAGGIADIWAFLSPAPSADDANVGAVLSYVMNPVTDPKSDEGDFLNVAECVTYLLFPYITCGAHADWDTGIAIANTTMDDGIFGLSTRGHCPARVHHHVRLPHWRKDSAQRDRPGLHRGAHHDHAFGRLGRG